jgi:hypothetical protein
MMLSELPELPSANDGLRLGGAEFSILTLVPCFLGRSSLVTYRGRHPSLSFGRHP